MRPTHAGFRPVVMQARQDGREAIRLKLSGFKQSRSSNLREFLERCL